VIELRALCLSPLPLRVLSSASLIHRLRIFGFVVMKKAAKSSKTAL
jgi:hypothetical protein